ncbi:MAG: hypothetical protein LBQ74_19945 [Prevotella sp.]|jgi:hypothetical protein|nr:hypothetical protein [Prevotella sp.]
MGKIFDENQIREIIETNRECEEYEITNYIESLEKLGIMEFCSEEEILDDFDEWKEQEDIAYQKSMDINYWSRF